MRRGVAKKKRQARKSKAHKRADEYPPDILLRIFNSRPLSEVVSITEHAVDRYRQRFRPGFQLGQARNDLLERMGRDGEFVLKPPRWVGSQRAHDTIGYVTIDDDVVLPVVDKQRHVERFVAPTCLYRTLQTE